MQTPRNNTTQTWITALVCSFLFTWVTFAETYYIDAESGNDSALGTSSQTAWKTLNRVNRAELAPGDTVLFKRNCIWRGRLIPRCKGSEAVPITYSDYGQGAKPLFLGSVNISDPAQWTKIGDNLWQSVPTSQKDIGNLIFNNEESVGFKKWNITDLKSQGDFWWNKNGNKSVVLFSTYNPGHFYTSIEAAIGDFIIYLQQGEYLTFKNLSFKYGAADGIEIRNSHHIIVSQCELSYIGGCELDPKVRYGGGIQFWGHNHDNTIERCMLWEIYDDALTNQGNRSLKSHVEQYNLYYINNLIWNCSEASFCFYTQPADIKHSTLKDIYFEHNTCINAGGGWGASQRPDQKGFHVYVSAQTAPLQSIHIRNNIFYKSRCALAFDDTQIHVLPILDIDHNCYYLDSKSEGITGLWTPKNLKIYKPNDFQKYQQEFSKDLHSILADPIFVDSNNHNYHLSSKSPCIQAGISLNIPEDIFGTTRSKEGASTIGAIEYTP